MNQRSLLRRGWVVMLALGIGGAGCDLEEDELAPRDVSESRTMASIGNSLTAGFQSSGLLVTGQTGAFPQLMARRIIGRSLVGPTVLPPGIGSTPGSTPLYIDETGNLTTDEFEDGFNLLTLLPALTYPIPYENIGVPGATTEEMLGRLSGDSTPEYGGANPFFDLILRNAALPGGGSAIQQVERLSPEIITLWTGNNEVLGGATSGSPQSDDPTADGYVFPVSVFEGHLEEMCDRIEALNPEMVVLANVPPVSAIPFTRFWSTAPPTSPFIRYNMEEDCDGLSGCLPESGDETMNDDDPVELVLLPAGTMIAACIDCVTQNCGTPEAPCMAIPASLTLSESEVQLINDAIAGYNAAIAREAAARGWALVDANANFLSLPTTNFGNNPLNTAFPWNLLNGQRNPRSAFTLDGVHPSEKGHAHVANLMMAALNDTYGTSYEMYDVDAVENIAGFERAPRVAAGTELSGRIDENGRESLAGMVRMFNPTF